MADDSTSTICPKCNINEKGLLYNSDTTETSSGIYKQMCHCENERLITARKLHMQLFLLTISFFFAFSAYNGLEALQSSLNVHIGQSAVGVIYAVLIICSLTVAPVCVGKWSPKVCFCLSWICYTSFTLANMHPTWWMMYTSAILLGFGASLVWCAQGVYLTSMAQKYSVITGKDYISVLNNFNGIFFSVFATTMIVGNLIGSMVFYNSTTSSTISKQSEILDSNYSSYNNLTVGEFCGARNCPFLQSHMLHFSQPQPSLVKLLLYTFLTCNALALLSACFLENMKSEDSTARAGDICSRLKEVFLLLKNPDLLLLIIPLISIRLFQSMSISAYNQAFVTCTLDVGMVGYVMMVRATTYTIASYISGKTGKCLHRAISFTVAMCLYISVALLWLLWTPNKQQLYMFFLIPSLEGLGSGIWRVQVGVILGWLFPSQKEAAFAQHNVWLSLGSCIVFGSSAYFCFYVKTWFILGVIGLGIISYSGLEVKLKMMQKEKSRSLNAVE